MSKRRRRERKEAGAPKRAMTAFLYYILDRRAGLKKEKPHLDNKQIISEMGSEWNRMKEEDKKKYLEKAAEDRKRYEKEKAAYDARMAGEGRLSQFF